MCIIDSENSMMKQKYSSKYFENYRKFAIYFHYYVQWEHEKNTVVNLNYVQSEHYREQVCKSLSEDFRILKVKYQFPIPIATQVAYILNKPNYES
jgi:hypothetical protein